MTSTETAPSAAPRLKARYRTEIVPALQEQFQYSNPMQIPGLTKVVVNMGVGIAARDAKLMDGAVRDLTLITGQKPLVQRARLSIAQIKLREGQPSGAKVTLRHDRLWELLDRLGYGGHVGCEYRPRGMTADGLAWFAPYRARRGAVS